MKVLLIDVDSTIPNLVLKKIERYYLDKGAEISWNTPLEKDISDEVWVSCIFTKNKHECEQYSHLPHAHIGGTGWEFDVLPDKTLVKVRDSALPKEIENVNPHINLGFTQRGCCWKCKWCVTPQKEGNPYPVGDLYDLWDGKADEIMLLDQNILSIPQHFKLICDQANKEGIKLHFNGGLDHRLLSEDIVKDLLKVKHVKYKFAFDDIQYLPTVNKAITLLQANGIACSTWYVLVGFNSTFEQDLWRLNYLKSRGQTAYVMRYEGCGEIYSALAGWANARPYFMAMTFTQFLNLQGHERWRGLVKAVGIQLRNEKQEVDNTPKESKDQQCLF